MYSFCECWESKLEPLLGQSLTNDLPRAPTSQDKVCELTQPKKELSLHSLCALTLGRLA